MKFLRLNEWRKYQHYKNRNPPWIKLHRDLLTSYTWTVLDDASRALAIACMILASETDNKIPLDRDFIQRRGQFKKRPDLRPLVEVGFAEVIDDGQVTDSASEMLADASNLHCNPSPELETETELDKHINKPRKHKHELPEDFVPKQDHYDIARELRINCDGEFQIMRDWALGNSIQKADWNATFRNWLKKAAKLLQGRYGTRQVTNAQAKLQRSGESIFRTILGDVVEDAPANSGNHGSRTDGRGESVVEGEIRSLPARGHSGGI